MNYQIIADEAKLDEFISFLPDNIDHEVYYICLFCRRKYAASFPNTKDAGQLARVTAVKSQIKNKIRRMECGLGHYVRDGVVAPQEGIALYISVNPRSLAKANRELLVELATRCADGNMNFNPISLATTAIHRAVDRKFFVDFDFDAEPEAYLPKIKEIFPEPEAYKVLRTRGGFHLLVKIEQVKGNKKWYPALTSLPMCDVRGSNTLTPVAGCVQGGFVPYFM